jgi:hypothetical protein
MRIVISNNLWTRGASYLMAGVLAAVTMAAPAGVDVASADAPHPVVLPSAGVVMTDPAPAPSSASEPTSPDLEVLQAEVQRLQILVVRLQHAIYVLQETEFDPAATPTLLEPLADLQDLFPDIAHRLCLASSPLGRGHMPDYCLDLP